MDMDQLEALTDAIAALTTNEDLDFAKSLLAKRRDAIAQINTSDLAVGDTVILTEPIRPVYMQGQEATVTKINGKTVAVTFPDNPSLRRYSGASDVRVPKSCVEVAGA